MSKQKEKKLKKLKKQKIWPYLLGIFMVIIVFAILAAAISAFLIVSIAYDKMQQGYDHSSKIAQVIEADWDMDDPRSMKEICENIMKTVPNIEDICIVDANKEIVCQYGATAPDWKLLMHGLSMGDAEFILANDEDNFIYFHGNKVEIAGDEVLWDALGDENEISEENLWKSEPLSVAKFWCEIPLDDSGYSVCVKNAVPIRQAEFLFVMTVLDVIVALALVLIVYYLISIFSLVLERRKLAKILFTDVVTGGFNMQYFIKNGNRLLKKNRKGKINYAVVTIRMEKYRNFCSCYGVKEGEELMECFHGVLQKYLSKKEILAHAEKADFALLLSYREEDELTQRLNSMMAEMAAIKSEQKKYFSVGVYRVLDQHEGIDSMYNCAGIARKKITEDSEKRISWFNDEMYQDQLWTQKVENDMEKALFNREFQVYLQPKYSTKEEVLSGAEALVRWIHPKEGFVAPYKFIPIFESNGFIIQLDDYMITEVARQQAKWIAEGKKVVPISVNVSRVHFVREDLAEHICQLVDQFHVPHDVIELELTESAFFDDKSVLLNTIRKLKAYGFAISMDDFGAGYSSLNSLKELPLDVVKLDAEFFRSSDEEGRGKLIVGDTISLAKKLDMRIVAEGIETREQVDFLASMNCDLIQGYYFAKPMPIAEFEQKAFH